MNQGDRNNPSQPVVVQVQRPRTQDLDGMRSDRFFSRAGAALTAILSIGAGFGGIAKTYHLVHENEGKLKALERKVEAQETELDLLCAAQFGAEKCYQRKARRLDRVAR